MAINNYNPNTGAKLKKGETVTNKATGEKVTQGTTFGASGSYGGSSSSGGGSSSSSSSSSAKTAQFGDQGQYTYAVDNKGVPYGNPIIANQSNLVQSTATEKAKLNTTATNIDNTVNAGTGVYGTPVKDQAGNVIGYEKFDYKTGKPLEDPNAKKDTPLPEGNVKDTLGNTYFSSMPKNMTYKLPESTVPGNTWVFDASGKPFEMDKTGKVTTNTVAEQEYNTNIQKDKEIETQNTMYDTLKANVSAAHQVIIDSIKQKAQEQKAAMIDLNARYLGSKQVAGFRTGATEYTPEIAMGILKNEEEEGIRRIKEIDDNMNLALAEAVSAKNDKDLLVAQQKFDTYSKLQKEKENAVIDQYKLYLDNQKYINDATKALETETRAKEDQGMQKLKAGAGAYLQAYNSSKDKKGYVQSIATQLGLSPEIVLGQILAAQPKAKGTNPGELSQTEIKANAIGEMATGMSSIAGADGYIDPQIWIAARKKWVEQKLNDADFLKNFKQYLNPESYNLIPEFKKKTTSSGKTS